MVLKVDVEINLVVIRFKIVYTGVTDFSKVFRKVFTYKKVIQPSFLVFGVFMTGPFLPSVSLSFWVVVPKGVA